MVYLIEKKRDGQKLSKQELESFFEAYMQGEVHDYQMSAFLMAALLRGMDMEETSALTAIMLHSGDTITLPHPGLYLLDKHSTGGVGDKTSIALSGVLPALGIGILKISGRGLAHTGGTIDKLESIPGLRFPDSPAEEARLLQECHVCFMQQTEHIVPLDKQLYALRDVTGTVQSIPLIASSIMSKKLAVQSDGILLDVKVGSGAFMKDIQHARELATCMIDIGKAFDRKVAVLISQMNEPLGQAIGNGIEVMEAVHTLQGKGPDDFAELIYTIGELANEMRGKMQTNVESVIQSGKALASLETMIASMGGDVSTLQNPERLIEGSISVDVLAQADGFIHRIRSAELGRVVTALGGGRMHKGDPINHRVGLLSRKRVGDPIKKGEPVATMYYDPAETQLTECQQKVQAAYEIEGSACPALDVVLDVIH